MDWSNVLSTIQMIGAGTAAVTAAGAGGEKDKEHAAAALSAIQIILQLHAALQPARLVGALPDGPASIESPPIPPGAQRMDPPKPPGAAPEKGYTPMDPPAPVKK